MSNYIRNINNLFLTPFNIYDPCFYQDLISIDEVPLFLNLKNNFEKIKIELINNIKEIENDTNNLFYKSLDNYVFSKENKKLKEIICGYHLFYHKDDNNDIFLKTKNNCPLTISIFDELKKEKIITNCVVSRLKSLSYISPHNDRLNDNTIRVHFCLETDPKCTITVGKETRQWIENNFLIFDATNYQHSIKHDGDKNRTIIIMDIKKEYLMRFYKNK